MKFFFTGKPIPQKRPRFRYGIVYNPQSKEKKAFKEIALEQMAQKGSELISKSPLLMRGVFGIAYPKTAEYKHVRGQNERVWAKGKPDLDNLLKFIMDILTHIAYEDDRQIVKIEAEKIYTTTPFTSIEIDKISA